MTIDQVKSINVGRNVLADIFGVTENYINELVLKSILPKNDFHNSYPLYDCLKAFLIYQEKKFNNKIEAVKSEKPQDLLARRNAELKAIQIEKEKNNLFPADEVQRLYLSTLAIIINELESFPIFISVDIMGINDQKVLIDIVKEKVTVLRTKIANNMIAASKVHGKKSDGKSDPNNSSFKNSNDWNTLIDNDILEKSDDD